MSGSEKWREEHDYVGKTGCDGMKRWQLEGQGPKIWDFFKDMKDNI